MIERNNTLTVPLMQSQDSQNDPNEFLGPSKATGSDDNTFLGIKLKKNVTRWNLFAIFYVFFLMTSIGGYINVQIVYLLRDKSYFNMDEEY